MSMVLNMAELAIGSEYALIYINMSKCVKILNIPKSTKIYPNVGKYVSIC